MTAAGGDLADHICEHIQHDGRYCAMAGYVGIDWTLQLIASHTPISPSVAKEVLVSFVPMNLPTHVRPAILLIHVSIAVSPLHGSRAHIRPKCHYHHPLLSLPRPLG